MCWLKHTEGRITVTCPNASCKKTFNTPLKTLNLQCEPVELYPACPFCLTRIEGVEVEGINKAEKLPEKKANLQENPTVKPASCEYHLGYLSERGQKEQIPEDCIICKDIVECMLKKMRT